MGRNLWTIDLWPLIRPLHSVHADCKMNIGQNDWFQNGYKEPISKWLIWVRPLRFQNGLSKTRHRKPATRGRNAFSISRYLICSDALKYRLYLYRLYCIAPENYIAINVQIKFLGSLLCFNASFSVFAKIYDHTVILKAKTGNRKDLTQINIGLFKQHWPDWTIPTNVRSELGNKRSQRNNERLSNYIATGGIVTGLIIYLTLYILIKNRPENLDGLENDWLQCFVNTYQTSFSLCHIVHNLYI